MSFSSQRAFSFIKSHSDSACHRYIMRRWHNIGWMLCQRPGRWHSIHPILCQRLDSLFSLNAWLTWPGVKCSLTGKLPATGRSFDTDKNSCRLIGGIRARFSSILSGMIEDKLTPSTWIISSTFVFRAHGTQPRTAVELTMIVRIPVSHDIYKCYFARHRHSMMCLKYPAAPIYIIFGRYMLSFCSRCQQNI